MPAFWIAILNAWWGCCQVSDSLWDLRVYCSGSFPDLWRKREIRVSSPVFRFSFVSWILRFLVPENYTSLHRHFEEGMAKSAATSTALPGELPRQKRAGISKNEQLMEAVRRGELTAVRRLVDKSGADVCTVNQYGLSCLQLAIIGGHTKLAEFIIQKGANIHSIDAQGWTALHDAAQMDMQGLVRKLVSKGCSVTSTTDLGELPIDVAGSVEMEKVLCAEMAQRGEEKLARDYETYLGLKHVSDGNRVIFPMSHRGPLPMCYTTNRGTAFTRSPKVQLQRRHSSPAHVLNKANQRHHHHYVVGRAGQGRDNRPEVDVTTGNELRHTKLQEAVIDRPLHTHDTARHCPYRGNINTPRVHRSSSIAGVVASTSVSSRRSTAGRGFFRRERAAELGTFHSSATLSAALGVCFDSVATDFEEDRQTKDTLDSPEDSTDSGPGTAGEDSSTCDLYTQERSRHISFCEQSVYEMARTKMTPSSVSTEKERAAGHLSAEERKERQEMADFKAADGDVGADDSDVDTSLGDSHEWTVSKEAIANLKRLPRKPSIIFPTQRRRSTEGVIGTDSLRRRSVTFQPEVLLQEMVLDGDLKAVKEILVSGTLNDINKLSPAGLTALHQSAIDGNLECAKALIASGANVNCADCELWTPLHAASMSGKIEIIRYLLSHGANSRLKNESGQTAYDVAKTGPIRKLLLCTMNGKSPDADEISDGEYSDEEEREYSHMESESDDDGEEPCYFDSPKTSHEHSASPSPDFGEHSDNVFLNGNKKLSTTTTTSTAPDSLPSSSSILDSTTTEDNTHSSSNNHPSEESAGNGFVSEDQGISTMDGSSDCSHRSRMLSEDEGTTRDVLDSDLVPGSLDYRFQEASLSCDVDTLLKLAKHRTEIDINRVNKSSGITALHHAVLEENYAMVQHLVKDFEADLHIKDRDGWTPLHAASAVGNIRIAQFLLENGAKASSLNNQCEFPVDVAEDEAMEKLLKNVMLGPSVGNLFK